MNYTITNINTPSLTPEDVAANALAYAGDHVAACVDRQQDTIDFLAMLARTRRRWDEIHDRTTMVMGPRLAEALVEAELSMFEYGMSYRAMRERNY